MSKRASTSLTHLHVLYSCSIQIWMYLCFCCRVQGFIPKEKMCKYVHRGDVILLLRGMRRISGVCTACVHLASLCAYSCETKVCPHRRHTLNMALDSICVYSSRTVCACMHTVLCRCVYTSQLNSDMMVFDDGNKRLNFKARLCRCVCACLSWVRAPKPDRV